MADQQFKNDWLETQQEYGVELNECTVASDPSIIKNVLSLPGIIYDKDPSVNNDAVPQAYVQVPYKALLSASGSGNPSSPGYTPDDGGVVSIVTSVNEKTGAVLLNASDVSAIPSSEKGAANGVATLGSDGKVPASQLPSGSATGGDLVIGTTTGTAADGKVVTDHINNSSNPHGVTKSQVGLGNVENKSVSTIKSEIMTAANVKEALGTGSGTSKFLREDGTWQTPPASGSVSVVTASIQTCEDIIDELN